MTKSLQWLQSSAVALLVFSLFSSVLYASDISTPPGKLVKVSDKQLHIHCTGSGSPLVVLESGLGGNSLDWVKVQPLLASFTRVCSYDRSGYGWSEGDALPRTGVRIAHELHDLLHQADEQGPYLLVGHSFGGLTVRLFASLYPEETQALVLLDASHEDQFAALKKTSIRKVSRSVTSTRTPKPVVPVNLPETEKTIALELAEKPWASIALRSEMRHFRDSMNQVRMTSLTSGLPVKVISRGKRVWPENDDGDRLEATWRALQEDLYQRLTSPASALSHQFALNSGHYVHLDEPRLVTRAIRKMVMQQRRIASLNVDSNKN